MRDPFATEVLIISPLAGGDGRFTAADRAFGTAPQIDRWMAHYRKTPKVG